MRIYCRRQEVIGGIGLYVNIKITKFVSEGMIKAKVHDKRCPPAGEESSRTVRGNIRKGCNLSIREPSVLLAVSAINMFPRFINVQLIRGVVIQRNHRTNVRYNFEVAISYILYESP